MSKHDTWVQIKSPTNFDQIRHLFPHGVPMRDPFPMKFIGTEVSLWIIDKHRLTTNQENALVNLIAEINESSVSEVRDKAGELGGLVVESKIIFSMEVGLEGFTRTLELFKFQHENPPRQNDSYQQLATFLEDQTRRWIEGNEKPKPLPKWEDIPVELKSPELEAIYQQARINSLLKTGEYTVLDFLMGNAVVNVLNEVDPDNEYSLYSEEQ